MPDHSPASACSQLPGLIRGILHRLVADDDPWAQNPEFLMEVVVSKYERRRSQTETVNAMPLYPTEAILWDENQVPKVHYTGESHAHPFVPSQASKYCWLSRLIVSQALVLHLSKPGSQPSCPACPLAHVAASLEEVCPKMMMRRSVSYVCLIQGRHVWPFQSSISSSSQRMTTSSGILTSSALRPRMKSGKTWRMCSRVSVLPGEPHLMTSRGQSAASSMHDCEYSFSACI